MLSILKKRHIRLLWLGQLLSAFGDRFFEIAVVWLSVQILGSEAGFVLAAGSVSRLIVGVLGGVYADRWHRQKTMIAVDILRTITILSLPVAALLGNITLVQLAVVAAIEGALSSIFDPALQASMPHLVEGAAELQASNGLLDVTHRMARIFAPGVAGVIIAFLPIEQFFTLDALTFAISAVAVWGIGRNFHWQPDLDPHATTGLKGIYAEIRGAMRLAYQNKPVFWAILSYIPANMVWASTIMIGLALQADNKFDVGVQGYSFLITAYGIGSVLSNIIVGSNTIRNRGRFFFAGVVVFGIGVLLLGLVSAYTLALGAMFFAALGTPMSDLMIVLMIQDEFPTNQVGKIYSLRLTISSVGFSMGLFFAAYLFQAVDVSTGTALMGLLLTLVGVAGLLRFWKPVTLAQRE